MQQIKILELNETRARGNLLQSHLCHNSLSHTANQPFHVITSAKGRGYVTVGICPSVCLFVCQQNNSNGFLFEHVANGPGNR